MNSNLVYQEELWEEMIGGNVVAMSPRPSYNHNRIAFNITKIFDRYLEGKTCTAINDGVDLYLTEKDRFVPDVMVVCDRNKIKWDGVHGTPDLVVEVLSPKTARYDRRHKKEVYEKCGVKEYWIVDPANRTIEQYLLQDGVLLLEPVYVSYPDYMLENMSEKERSEVVTHFKCSLYDDLDIPLDKIFSGLVLWQP